MSFLPSIGRRAAAAAALVLAPLAAFAHHGWSDYDADQVLTLPGVVKVSHYGNPHAAITLESGGKTYEVVLAPVSRMESRGASKDAVAVGKSLTVVGYPSKSHPGEIRAERIVFKDGAAEKTVELR